MNLPTPIQRYGDRDISVNEIVARTQYGRVHPQELWTQFAFTCVLFGY